MAQQHDMTVFEELVDRATDTDGDPLAPLDRALIEVGLAASVVSLDEVSVRSASAAAFAHGATPQQVQEVISVISGLGVHSLMISAMPIIEEATRAGHLFADTFTPEEQVLWDKRVGDDPFWQAMEAELPGFLRAMLKLSPRQFEAFFDYCAVPWINGTVRARTKELLAMASDAVAQHRFEPGFRLHLANAVKLGAGRTALRECLALARNAP